MGGVRALEHSLSSLRATVVRRRFPIRGTMEIISATSLSSLWLGIALTIWPDEMSSSGVLYDAHPSDSAWLVVPGLYMNDLET
jgi:hypothetical protein